MFKEFTIVKRGYCPEEVEKYINELENQLEEYKEKDNSITNAIINAQVAADNIIKNAKFEAEEIKTTAIKHLSLISNSISEQKEIVKDFQDHYSALVNKYLKDVNITDFLDIFSHINELENYLVTLKKSKPKKNSDNN